MIVLQECIQSWCPLLTPASTSAPISDSVPVLPIFAVAPSHVQIQLPLLSLLVVSFGHLNLGGKIICFNLSYKRFPTVTVPPHMNVPFSSLMAFSAVLWEGKHIVAKTYH